MGFRIGGRAAARACFLGLFLAAAGAWADEPPRTDAAASVVTTAAPVDPGVSRWQIVTAVLYLGVLAGVGYALVFYARRGFTLKASSATQGQSLRVLATTRVSPTLTISLLDVEGRRVLVAATTSGTSMIELSKNEQS